MSVIDKTAIRKLAEGDTSQRHIAIAVHREMIRRNGLQPGDPYFDFMSEVDNPCPDFGLRARYRCALLALQH